MVRTNGHFLLARAFIVGVEGSSSIDGIRINKRLDGFYLEAYLGSSLRAYHHPEKFERMLIYFLAMDPSMFVGFLFRNEEQWEDNSSALIYLISSSFGITRTSIIIVLLQSYTSSSTLARLTIAACPVCFMHWGENGVVQNLKWLEDQGPTSSSLIAKRDLDVAAKIVADQELTGLTPEENVRIRHNIDRNHKLDYFETQLLPLHAHDKIPQMRLCRAMSTVVPDGIILLFSEQNDGDNFVHFSCVVSLGNTALLGLQKDFKLTAADYSWLGTIFYHIAAIFTPSTRKVSYLLFEYPQSLALQRHPVGKWLAFNGILWAILVASQVLHSSRARIKNRVFWWLIAASLALQIALDKREEVCEDFEEADKGKGLD
ncbi:uncharacterized protein MELLADRAFT_106967 [Melampsora larici-populina 98AG31]|uniref:Uncharacterized protein n=1 Tax=Melampsora larici-populina (strain 98AG31 / pathotype 3-4-7) TaxID=747676 RepID=F4RN80_MELLP|nr:uncharacterized protein MELLADRAFT_106967 [Melampsora larici-populina 98AG31]EGG06252.1 hypothetical protein MELLADRAFT_106967 [Melampsora larici-populina 98AG31]